MSFVYGTVLPVGNVGVMCADGAASFDDFLLNSNYTVINQYTYAYDKDMNRTDAFDFSTSTTNYYYDGLNRLTTENRIGNNAYLNNATFKDEVHQFDI